MKVGNKILKEKDPIFFKAMDTFLLTKEINLLQEFISYPHEAQKTTFKSVFFFPQS